MNRIVELIRKEAYEEGYKQGYEEGFKIGIYEGKSKLVKKWILKGIDTTTIAQIMELPEEEIRKLAE